MRESWVPVHEWHRVVNERDIAGARRAVTDGIVMGGPRGEAVGVDVFVDWIEHAGICLMPVSWHPVADEVIVVEQDATWPDSPDANKQADPVRVATLFRLEGDQVAEVLRFDDLDTAFRAAGGYW